MIDLKHCTKARINETIKDIDQTLAFWNIEVGSRRLSPKQESDTVKYEVIFKLADFLDDMIFIGKMIYYIRLRPYRLSFDTFLVYRDYTPVTIKNPNTRFLAKRHILKLNSLLRFGSFSIDDTGLTTFHLMWNFESNVHLAMRTIDDIEKWMKIGLATTMSTVKVNMTKLLMMFEIIDQSKYESVVEGQKNAIRQLPKFFIEDQEKLKTLILDGVRLKLGGPDVKVEVKKDILPPYPYPFYQRVKLNSLEYQGRLATGGYASIYVVRAKMMVEEQDKDRKYTVEKDKYFLVKMPRQPTGSKKTEKEYVLEMVNSETKEPDSRINIERRVISHPKNKEFQHIARYYDDYDEKKKPVRNILFMENYMPQNLHEFNARKELSMGTKLSWLYQLAHALVYLQKNKIVHVDLKPSNVVVAKNFFMKVIDFAESLVKDDPTFENDRRATTMPFSSPETLGEDSEKISYESDVFSYAHIAYELLAGKVMVGFKRNSDHKIREKYKKKSYKLLPILNWLNFLGPKYLMQYIYMVIMLCSTPDPNCRFPQEVLLNFIKEFAYFTEKLF